MRKRNYTMKIFKSAVFIVIALSTVSLCTPARAGEVLKAADLPAITAADISVIAAEEDFKLPDPLLDELKPMNDQPPVIITVIGIRFDEVGWGPLEPGQFIRLFHLFFPNKRLDETGLKKAFTDYNKQFDFLYEGGDFHPEQAATRMPNNSIETALEKLPEYASGKMTIVPFKWSRDPEETDKVVPVFVEKLAAVYDQYKGTGRPIYILAHSWGTVLMHETMHRLEKIRPDVRIDKFITIGSPLVPGNAVIKLFMAIEVTGEHLQKAVTKPAILSHWKNVWSSRDPFSNAINAADENLQVDASVEKVEPALKKLILFNSSLRMLAKNDFLKIINIDSWHSSYLFDFHASLESIDKDIKVIVFRPMVAPEVLSSPRAAAGR